MPKTLESADDTEPLTLPNDVDPTMLELATKDPLASVTDQPVL